MSAVDKNLTILCIFLGATGHSNFEMTTISLTPTLLCGVKEPVAN